MQSREYYIYILSNKTRGTLYIGVTGNISNRIEDHKNGKGSYFTNKYNLKILVYYEIYENVWDAIEREKSMKKWNRDWKIKLIESVNPMWKDLSYEI